MLEYKKIICNIVYYNRHKIEYSIGAFNLVDKYLNGNIAHEIYYLNGNRHRENAPADIFYYENGLPHMEFYHLNGEYHREDGPAYILYNKNGEIENEVYWLNEVIYSKEEYYKQIKLNLYW